MGHTGPGIPTETHHFLGFRSRTVRLNLADLADLASYRLVTVTGRRKRGLPILSSKLSPIELAGWRAGAPCAP
jgi:hypothetical protein